MEASDSGEITGIGFDTDEAFGTTLFSIGGSDTNPLESTGIKQFSAGDGGVHYKINVGLYYTGSMNYLVFVADDDSNASSNVTFSNVKIRY